MPAILARLGPAISDASSSLRGPIIVSHTASNRVVEPAFDDANVMLVVASFEGAWIALLSSGQRLRRRGCEQDGCDRASRRRCKRNVSRPVDPAPCHRAGDIGRDESVDVART
jgi:hypothetical protein